MDDMLQVYLGLRTIMAMDNEERAAITKMIPSFWHFHYPMFLALHEVYGDIKLSKGYSDDIVVKETVETFRKNEMEGDHPRDEDGKFTDTGRAPKPSKPKVAWGGRREGAGRWPKNADEAVDKLRVSMLKDDPEITDDEVKKRILTMAEEKGKTDVIQYLTDPEAYWKRRQKEFALMLHDKYRKAAHSGGHVIGMDTPDATDALRKQVAVSERRFNREVQKQKSLLGAYRTLKDEYATEEEKTTAKLLLVLGNIAIAAGIAGLLVTRPSLATSGLKMTGRFGKKQLDEFMKYNQQRVKSALSSKRSGTIPTDVSLDKFKLNWIASHDDIHHIRNTPNPKWFRLVKITNGELPSTNKLKDDPIFRRIIADREVGQINRRVTRTLMRRFPNKFKGYDPNSEYAIIFGENIKGIGNGSRFQVGPFKTIDRYKASEYKPDINDLDAITGIRFMKRVSGQPTSVDREALFNIKQMWRSGPKNGLSEKKLKEMGLRYRKNRGINSRNAVDMHNRIGKIVEVEDTKKFEAWWEKRLKTMGVTDEELLPRIISRPVKPHSREWKIWKDAVRYGTSEEITNDHRTWWAKNVQPLVNAKVITGLVAGGSLSSQLGYYFSEELGDLPAAYMQQQKTRTGEGDIMEGQRKFRAEGLPDAKERAHMRAHEWRMEQAKQKRDERFHERWQKSPPGEKPPEPGEGGTRSKPKTPPPSEIVEDVEETTGETVETTPEAQERMSQESIKNPPGPEFVPEDEREVDEDLDEEYDRSAYLKRVPDMSVEEVPYNDKEAIDLWMANNKAGFQRRKMLRWIEQNRDVDDLYAKIEALTGATIPDYYKAAHRDVNRLKEQYETLKKVRDIKELSDKEMEEYANTVFRGFSSGIIVKGMEEVESEDFSLTTEAFTDAIAEDIIKMFSDTSKICHMAVNSGMPGSEKYVDLHDTLVMLYQIMRSKVKSDEGLGVLNTKRSLIDA